MPSNKFFFNLYTTNNYYCYSMYTTIYVHLFVCFLCVLSMFVCVYGTPLLS